MKAAIVLIIILGVWLAYKQHETPLPGARRQRLWTRKPGSVPSTSRGFGSTTTNLSRSGNSSPGSGTPAAQPALASTWAIGGKYNIGNVGVSYK